MTKKKEVEPEGHPLPDSTIPVEPSEDKTKVREITDEDGNILSDEDLYNANEADMTGAGSGDPSVDHPEPVSGGRTKEGAVLDDANDDTDDDETENLEDEEDDIDDTEDDEGTRLP